MYFTTLLSSLAFTTLISAQSYGSTAYYVSDCDGVTNAAWYSASLNVGSQCVTWGDGNMAITQMQSDADGFTCEMVVYADPNCQIDATIDPGTCYTNIGSFAILCTASAA